MPKLTYFDFHGGRGEDCRLALHIAGVDFEDIRVNRAQWMALKPSTPFGSLPTFEVENHEGVLAQSNAILGLIGRHHGLLPADPWEAAQHASILEAVEDLYNQLTPSGLLKDPEEKRLAREALATGYLQRWGANLERLITGPYFAGEQLSVADLKVFVVMRWIVDGGVDHIGADVFDAHPKLKALFEAVKSHEKVVDWYTHF